MGRSLLLSLNAGYPDILRGSGMFMFRLLDWLVRFG